MWKRGRAQVWKKQRPIFAGQRRGDDVPIWLQHLLVANSYTCGLPILHTGLGFWKKTPHHGCLGFASCRLTSLLNPPAQARDVCSWQCEPLPNENPWHSMNHEPYWSVHLPGSLAHGLWNIWKNPYLAGQEFIHFLAEITRVNGSQTS